MNTREKIEELVGLKGFLSDGFNEIHEELGFGEAYDFSFEPCFLDVVEESYDCHKIRIYMNGRAQAILSYVIDGDQYEITEVSVLDSI